MHWHVTPRFLTSVSCNIRSFNLRLYASHPKKSLLLAMPVSVSMADLDQAKQQIQQTYK